MIRSALLLCLLSVGCTGPGAFYVDERFSPDERAAIQQAADTWTLPIDLVFGAKVSAFDTDRRVIVRVADRQVMEMASELARANPQVKAVTIDQTRILVQPDAVAPMWYSVAHELGHGMGIDAHSDDPSALMYYTRTAEARGCVTKADAELFRSETGMRIRPGC